jgi:pyridoxine 5-phosphate synthase
MTPLLVGLDALALLRECTRATTPDPAAAAVLAELGGAAGVAIGLRTDRRHSQERDAKVLRALVHGRLQLRIPPAAESLKVVAPIRPDAVVLVPERADELAQRVAFDLALAGSQVGEAAKVLREAGLPVLALVEGDVEQVKIAHRLGLAGVALSGVRLGVARQAETRERELDALDRSVRLAAKLGLAVQVAHGLDLDSAALLASLPGLDAVEIGHAVVSRALLVGFERAVADHVAALGRPSSGSRR